MDRRILVERIDPGKELLLGGLRRENDGLGVHSELLAFPSFVANINLRSRIVSDEDHCKAGHRAFGLQPLDSDTEFVIDLASYFWAGDNLARHTPSIG